MPKPARIPYHRDNIDYKTLPDQALIPMREVCKLTNMSQAVLYRRMEKGDFPRPVKHGNNNNWQWGTVRGWLDLVAEQNEGVE